MHILLSNDDGYQAPGLCMLASALGTLEDVGVTVIAPDRNRSGSSNSLTLRSPLYVNTADNGFMYVDGTPTDCVHLAINGGLLEKTPDIVISGINAGANLGDDVLYSGTVAAAMESRFLGCPALAVSLSGNPATHFETAVQIVLGLIEWIRNFPSKQALLLNVNVPDLPYAALAGFEVTRLGHRHRPGTAMSARDQNGRTGYWLGSVGPERDGCIGTDFHAINNRRVSITPLQTDLTRHSMLEEINLIGFLDMAGKISNDG